MMNWQKLELPNEVYDSVKSKTDFTVPDRSSEIVKGILVYFKNLHVDLSKESLLNNNYENLNSEEKDMLLVYFYWMHNRGLNAVDHEFVSIKLIQKHLKLIPNYENRYLREYLYTHPILCPICGVLVDVSFKNLKGAQIIETECQNCNHILGDSIFARCSCPDCKHLIHEAESFVYSLPEKIESWVRKRNIELCNEMREQLNDQKLKWFADKYSSDLSKDEREAISYRPNSVLELKAILGRKSDQIISKLVEKKAIIEKVVRNDISAVAFELKKCLFFSLKYKLGYKNVAFNECNFKATKVKYIKITKQKRWYPERTVVNIVFENSSFEYIPVLFNPSRNTFFEELKKEMIELFSVELPIYLTGSMDLFCSKIKMLNPYFFASENFDEYPALNSNSFVPLFKSRVEQNKYHFLIKKYTNSIIMVNVRLADLIVIKSIESFYNADELKYLRNCILDFVFYSEEGLPIKVIELQRGEHHNTDEYIRKDKLKKSAIKRIGIFFEETF